MKLRTPKAYLGWAFLAVIPLAVAQGALAGEIRVLALAIAGSVGVDVTLALAIAFAIDAARRRPGGVDDPARPSLWRGVFARRRSVELFWPSGALLCGAIVGLVLDPTSPAEVPLAAGALASFSKHVLRYRARHVFNPAAFGLLACGVLFSERASWWGALPKLSLVATLAMLVVGAVVLDRSRKLPAALAFLVAYYTIFLVVGLIAPDKAAEAFRSPFSNAALFFALFMVSDPPTAPVAVGDQLEFGIIIAAGAALLELTLHGEAYLFAALLAANVFAAAARTTRHQAMPRLRALTVSLATLAPVAPVIWLLSGPLAGGGALFVGASGSLVAAHGAGTQASGAGGSAGAPAPAQAFQAQVTGTVRQGPTSTGLIEIQLALTVTNQPLSSLEISLFGQQTAGGGVQVTSSDVTLGTSSAPTLYRGTVTGLQGTSIAASVQSNSGSGLALQAQLQIDPRGGAVSGTLSGQPASG